MRARPVGFFGYLRLRHKLALMLTIAALLPVLGASTVAMRLVLAGLKSGVRTQTERTMRVALNLVLANVKEVFEEAIRLSEQAGLSDCCCSIRSRRASCCSTRSRSSCPASSRSPTRPARWSGGASSAAPRSAANLSSTEAIRGALSYERRVTIARGPSPGSPLMIRASAPVVDDAYQLRGAVVVYVPLDAEFADCLKAQLAADVIVYQADAPTASSFVAVDGRREVGFAAPAEVTAAVLGGATRVIEANAYGRMFSVGYAPLQDYEGHRLGMLAVAADEDALVAAKMSAWRSLALGGASAVLFALALAALLSRRLTRPLGHLHAGALAVARGDLDHQIVQETGDEIGDLAVAFAQMTRAVKENQERLAARMREIVTLHEIGRAVSSVLGLDEVLRKIVEEVASVLGAERGALLITRPDGGLSIGAGVRLQGAELLPALGEVLQRRGGPVRIEDVHEDDELRVPAENARVAGPLLAVPLEQKDRNLGMLRGHAPPRAAVHRRRPAPGGHLRQPGGDGDLQRASLRRGAKVVRGARDQGQGAHLRAGRGQPRAGEDALGAARGAGGAGALRAHGGPGPARRRRGARGQLAGGGDPGRRRQLVRQRAAAGAACARALRRAAAARGAHALLRARRAAGAAAGGRARRGAGGRTPAGARAGNQSGPARSPTCRGRLSHARRDRGRRGGLQPGAAGAGAGRYARRGQASIKSLEALTGYLEQYAYLFRNTHAIRTAIRRITRIVGALKGYSHLDQAKVSAADLHEGIENTLVILHSELKYGINVTRDYAELPAVPVYVDELNQVWTNLIHNAVQALGGKGEILIETRVADEEKGANVAVTIQDNGPGIPPDVMPRIFEPFFTTKPKGEGTGLGLGIVKQIVDKHGGRIDVTSKPGCTRFTVRLPIAGPERTTTTAWPPAWRDAGAPSRRRPRSPRGDGIGKLGKR